MPTPEELVVALKKQMRQMQLNAAADDAAKAALKTQFDIEDVKDENEALRDYANSTAKKEKAKKLAVESGLTEEELLKAESPQEMVEMAYEAALAKVKAGGSEDKVDESAAKPKVKTTDVTGGGPEPVDYKKYQGDPDGLANLWGDLKQSGRFYATVREE